ncbi:ejaculatory bulb-specific protein 3-like [Macrosteles quadrilineatus]|uniref:ejaculatory bulb-specific protein 3-like n=1 Tax=Macrosteles quadrilineatus TaxID=74068 RepID=UPI0023E14046|nr:ejaculatory bulb-specific protein 3-like [Macrosteles quadrilineatus]
MTMYLAVLVVCGLAVVAADDQYTTKYDDVDLDNVLRNNRLLRNYHNCIMDKGPCTPDAQELKKNLPEALDSECAKCSEKQKQGAEKVLKFLYEKKPQMFKELESKFDPDGKYRAKYKKRIEAAGVRV